MEIHSSGPASARPRQLQFVIAVENGSEVSKVSEWKIEIFTSLHEHIEVVRGKIAEALKDPKIVAAGYLFRRGSGGYGIVFGSESLEREQVCKAGLGVPLLDLMEMHDIMETAINNHLNNSGETAIQP